MTRQEGMFMLALAEDGIPIADLSIDHEHATCRNGGKEYGLIFPRSLVKLVMSLPQTKLYPFSFVGMHTHKRVWVRNHINSENHIAFTPRGRHLPKDEIDRDYYAVLCASKYALCPAGDYRWSYRFLEACLCRAMPVISQYAQGFMDGFHWRHHETITEPTEAELQHNQSLFFERHTFIIKRYYADRDHIKYDC